VLAKALGITAPQWTGKVLAGAPCNIDTKVFCPIRVTATPDGRFVALADFSGRLEVVDTATGKVVLDKIVPGPANLNISSPANLLTAWVNVWISPNGRLASRDLVVVSPSSGAESTMGFGIWDVATGQALVTNGPTPKSPWLPMQNLAFGPGDSVMLTFDEEVPRTLWVTASVGGGAIRFLDKYQSQIQPDDVAYSEPQSAWAAIWDKGYALWSTAGVRNVIRPDCPRIDSEAIDDEGLQFACEADYSTINGSRHVEVWDIPTGRLSSRVSTGTYGVVQGIAFFDGGRSIALTVSPETYEGTDASVLVFSLHPRPVLRSVTSLPDIAGNWSILPLGGFAVALGETTRGGYCCVAVVSGS
jgi:WD40 repeat protein